VSFEPLISIVDDDEAFRSSLDLLISSKGFRVASFASAHEFLAAFDPQVPGCLIIDVHMPETSGLALQRTLAARALQPSVIMMTGFAEVAVVVRAMHQGAVEFLQKTCPEEELLDAIRHGLELDQQNRKAYARQTSIQGRLSLLSPPENEVLKLVLQGKANKSIAVRLGVSPRTVEDRRARIMQKLRVDSVPQLVSLAILGGINVEVGA
jgi:two-component system, LuxR family, response regulator FixJ